MILSNILFCASRDIFNQYNWNYSYGLVAEWSKAPDSKHGMTETGVQIKSGPFFIFDFRKEIKYISRLHIQSDRWSLQLRSRNLRTSRDFHSYILRTCENVIGGKLQVIGGGNVTPAFHSYHMGRCEYVIGEGQSTVRMPGHVIWSTHLIQYFEPTPRPLSLLHPDSLLQRCSGELLVAVHVPEPGYNFYCQSHHILHQDGQVSRVLGYIYEAFV